MTTTPREIDNALQGDVSIPSNYSAKLVDVLLQDAAASSGKDASNLRRIVGEPVHQALMLKSELPQAQAAQPNNTDLLQQLLSANKDYAATLRANELAVGEAKVQQLQTANKLATQKTEILANTLSQAGMNPNDYGNARSDLLASLQQMQLQQRSLIAKRDEENSSFIGKLFGAYTNDPNFVGQKTQKQVDQLSKDSLDTSKVLEQLLSGTAKLAQLDQGLLGKQTQDMLNAEVASTRAVAQKAANIVAAKANKDVFTEQQTILNTNRQISATESSIKLQGQQVAASIAAMDNAERRTKVAEDKADKAAKSPEALAIEAERLKLLETKNNAQADLIAAGIDPTNIKATDKAYVSYVTQGSTVTSLVQGRELYRKHNEQLRKTSADTANALELWHGGANAVLNREVMEQQAKATGVGKAKSVEEEEQLMRQVVANVLEAPQKVSGQEAQSKGYVFASNIGSWLPAAGSGYDRLAKPEVKLAIEAVRKSEAAQKIMAFIGGGADTGLALKLTDGDIIDAVAGKSAITTDRGNDTTDMQRKAKQLSEIYAVQVALNNANLSPELVGLPKQTRYEVFADKRTGQIVTGGQPTDKKIHQVLNLLDSQDMFRLVFMREINSRRVGNGSFDSYQPSIDRLTPAKLNDIKVPQ